MAEDNAYLRKQGVGFMFIHKITVTNNDSQDAYNLVINVPLPDDASVSWQDFSCEEFYPVPEEIVTKDGRREAVYKIKYLSAGSSVVLEQRFAVRNYAVSFSIDAADIDETIDVSSQVDNSYLQPEEGIESNDPAIIAYAKETAAGATNPYLIARRIYADINLFMSYENNSMDEHGALQALKRGTGNCQDYTNLFVACLRAMGIPARWHDGYLYNTEDENMIYEGGGNLIAASPLSHRWAEFYLEGVGWVVADPTVEYFLALDEEQSKLVAWDHFANITSTSRLLWLNAGSTSENNISYDYQGKNVSVAYQSYISLNIDISPFKDLVGHWAREDILYLYHKPQQIVRGVSSDYFGASLPLTRAQLVTMINRAMGYNGEAGVSFSDVSATYWASVEINAALTAGYIKGYPDGCFYPNRYVTRAEMAAIIARIADLPEPAATPFTDLNMPGVAWAANDIASLYAAGLASGVSADKFAPDKSITRAEGAVFLARLWQSIYYSGDN